MEILMPLMALSWNDFELPSHVQTNTPFSMCIEWQSIAVRTCGSVKNETLIVIGGL